ncbi:hypothetical protein HYG81_09005 [Natrinema zhouii]|uniref:Uncharacterized protein n=1 Tax=Natrinema zhouii TaxID=1710539 RepID=A0A7D6GRN9_9EURY|nr:hypothetical protein [Natrinema zhouii]QLK27721.1 hypothetical protein HYG81_09005 [Natrinema zhouii]
MGEKQYQARPLNSRFKRNCKWLVVLENDGEFFASHIDLTPDSKKGTFLSKIIK